MNNSLLTGNSLRETIVPRSSDKYVMRALTDYCSDIRENSGDYTPVYFESKKQLEEKSAFRKSCEEEAEKFFSRTISRLDFNTDMGSSKTDDRAPSIKFIGRAYNISSTHAGSRILALNYYTGDSVEDMPFVSMSYLFDGHPFSRHKRNATFVNLMVNAAPQIKDLYHKLNIIIPDSICKQILPQNVKSFTLGIDNVGIDDGHGSRDDWELQLFIRLFGLTDVLDTQIQFLNTINDIITRSETTQLGPERRRQHLIERFGK